MSTQNAFYVKYYSDKISEMLQTQYPNGQLQINSSYIGITLQEEQFAPPREDLLKLSQELSSEITWLSFQSVVDGFQFHRWVSGAVVRTLVYGCFEERVWEEVAGEPEPWERDVFFGERAKSLALKFALPAEIPRIEKIWREKTLLVNETIPQISSRCCALEIIKHYGFPN